ncbi:MAG: cellulase family glycosylhydrolase [Ardenticatenaceae bacterium]|nr:cellulase family glycosylhydrolase [Ardenticatenaceae bacterium]
MKKQLFLSLLILALLLAACGGSEEPAVQAPTPQPTQAAAEPTAAEPEAEPTLPPPAVETNREETAAGEVDEPPTPEPTPEPSGPIAAWPADDFGYGIQIHGNATYGDPVATMDVIQNRLGLDWIKVQIQWWLVDPEPDADQWFFYDGVIDEAYRHNLRVMVSVVGAPQWTRAAGGENGPPDDYANYAAFLEEMLTRYDGQIHAIEVWNEQNLDREWTTTNGISPEDYVRFLQVAYEAIKAHDPNIIVISGALSPTGTGDWVRWADDFEYMDRALAAGMLNYADCVGAHHNGYNIAPDVTFEAAGSTAEAGTAEFRGPFDNPHHSWSFKTTLDTYAQKIQAIDPNKKLCVTEFGWASSEGYDEIPPTFEFARDNSLQEQADFIVQAYQQMHDSDQVWLAFLFNFDFGNKGNGPTDDTVPYSIVDINGAPRPAFDAVATMEKPR